MVDETKRVLNGDEVASRGLTDWRPLSGRLEARFATGDFARGLDLVTAIGEAAESADHHPDLDLRYPHLTIALTSHDVGGMTQRDVDLARRISELAAERGIASVSRTLARVELALDTDDMAAIRPFWAAVLGMDETGVPDELTDPDGDLPTIWFQESEHTSPAPQRWHLDLWVPPEVVAERIDAALAAGGMLVSEEHAPSFVVLADAQGNKVCLCTHLERD